MKKTNLIFLLLILSVSVISFAFGGFGMQLSSSWRKNNFSCDANVVMVNQDYRLTMAITYFIESEHGIAVLKGELAKGENSYHLSRKTYFNTNNFQNLTNLTSTLSIKTPADNVPNTELQKILPPFYLDKDKKLDFRIYPQGWRGYVFSTGYVPAFYCTRY
ncbi:MULTISPECIES: hypothetical protein [Proteus]|uniref:FidL-like membrane protein n=2 Tax=Morganellaceae TaxID=1903414 RepID=A0ABS0VZE3_9GAMM|nr:MULTISPECIES: hypothetical protein [Proteus]MBJ2116417.1 hypothetical protein [Proteus penneri]NBM13195.1 hypothetical protein [Proteus sp. G2670]NBM34348.1 hypothetical protein [Proteus sp. G2664]NBM67807.1 hypothetical protein [Proteus sp. G2663]NBN03810.1 hypothetical protein [Proteus sp. G2665]